MPVSGEASFGVEVEPVVRFDRVEPAEAATAADSQPQTTSDSQHPQFLLANPAVEVRYYLEKAERAEGIGRRVHCACWLGRGASGAPGYAHGGAQAALLEEAMVRCCHRAHASICNSLRAGYV